jgi:hypothetical protein
VLIHLFNLRRYKTVFFPHTRFLKNIQLNSRRQSQVRYKWLLIARLLFLLLLVLAFAQPFFSNSNKDTGHHVQVVYLDNSASMSVKKGTRTLFDIARSAAEKQVRAAKPGTEFLLVTNDKPASYQPMPAERMLAVLAETEISSSAKTATQVLSGVQSLMQNEAIPAADLYYYSDFQQNSFTAQQDASLLKNIDFYGVPVQSDEKQNLFIDTAYLLSPVLQTGQTNQLVVRTRIAGKAPKDNPVLQLSVNGQVKTAASPVFNEKNESLDTLAFQVNDAGWQQLSLTVNDASVRFDDTFRVTARSTPSLSILVLNEGQNNPYIQAAFRAYNGFRLTQTDVSAAPADFKQYNLVIVNGITHFTASLGKSLAAALQQGQSICIFPGRTNNYNGLNEGLQQLGDIHLDGMDTAAQTASSLQQGADLVKDLFEHIPENVQLPQANWHYRIRAGLSANQQAVLSFRNGDPFLARYSPAKGSLYICAASADLPSGNFPGSYFFVPFLYQMAVQSRGGDVYALTTGSAQPAYLPLSNVDERNMVHLYGNGLDVIPAQRPSGAGLDVFAGQTVKTAGFYTLAAPGSDTTEIALNTSRTESALETWSPEALQSQWKSDHIKWLQLKDTGAAEQASGKGSFPLWKVCVILALFMLAAETLLLAGRFRKPTVAVQ